MSHIIFNNGEGSPLGELVVAGIVQDSPGLASYQPVRRLAHYALVYLIDGGGWFADELGYKTRLRAGDLLFLFPNIGHTYGPGPDDNWQELFIIFSGPVFELWQQTGMLQPKTPLRHLEPVEYWVERLSAVAWRNQQPGEQAALMRVSDLQVFLAGALGYQQHEETDEVVDDYWLTTAKAKLRANLNCQPDMTEIADSLGMSYSGFRKRFRKAAGVSPTQYHTTRRIDRASSLLLDDESLTVKAVALQLGFRDEYHFSRRFKQIVGMSPTAFRRVFATTDHQ